LREPDLPENTAPAWLTRRVLGWALFDVASSTYIALVPTFFGLYFAAVIARGEASASAWWGAIAAAGLLVAGILAPIFGAYADRTARWFRVVVVATALCVLATVLLPAAAGLGVLAAAAAFLVAQVGYTLATGVYDSLVVDVAAPGQRGRISGLGWALGLLGGIVAIVVALLMMQGVPPASQVQHLGTVFGAAGVLFAALAVPGLAGLRGLRTSATPPAGHDGSLAASLVAVGTTLRLWRQHRQALQVLFSFFLINDVLVTIHFFIAIVLSTRFGLAVEGLLWLSLLYHLIAIPSTVLLGTLADRWGPKPTVLVMCCALSAAILLLAFGRAEWVPVAAVALLGLVFASIQAVFRSLYASVVPPERAAELFGFNAVAGRLSAALGPLIFGVAAAAFGSSAWALCLLFLPLAAGAWLLAAANLPGHGPAIDRAPAAAAVTGDRR
jgi:UMF1 family MFS transporter